MLYSPLSEFALGGFLEHDFAADSGDKYVSATFDIKSTSSVQFAGLKEAHTKFTSVAGASTTMVGAAWADGSFNIVGTSEFNVAVGETKYSNFAIQSQGTFVGKGGLTLPTSFFINANSQTNFMSLEGHEFDMRGSSDAIFYSEADKYLLAEIAGKSSTSFYGGSYQDAVFNISAKAQTEFNTLRVVGSVTRITSEAQTKFNGFGDAWSGFNVNSGATSNFRGAYILSTSFHLNGLSYVDGVGASVNQGTFNLSAGSNFLGVGANVLSTHFDIAGSSGFIPKAGSPIALYMDPAYDQIIRPNEIRLIIRKEEDRKVKWR